MTLPILFLLSLPPPLVSLLSFPAFLSPFPFFLLLRLLVPLSSPFPFLPLIYTSSSPYYSLPFLSPSAPGSSSFSFSLLPLILHPLPSPPHPLPSTPPPSISPTQSKPSAAVIPLNTFKSRGAGFSVVSYLKEYRDRKSETKLDEDDDDFDAFEIIDQYLETPSGKASVGRIGSAFERPGQREPSPTPPLKEESSNPRIVLEREEEDSEDELSSGPINESWPDKDEVKLSDSTAESWPEKGEKVKRVPKTFDRSKVKSSVGRDFSGEKRARALEATDNAGFAGALEEEAEGNGFTRAFEARDDADNLQLTNQSPSRDTPPRPKPAEPTRTISPRPPAKLNPVSQTQASGNIFSGSDDDDVKVQQQLYEEVVEDEEIIFATPPRKKKQWFSFCEPKGD